MQKKKHFLRNVVATVACLAALTTFSGCEKIDEEEQPESVEINGVRWATRNVDAPGTFTKNPEDAGMLYQWNRKIGWSSTDPMVASNGSTTWNDSGASGTKWEAANDPSPAGYRVPTLEELETLLDKDKVSNEKTTLNGVGGVRFTDITTKKTMFVPYSNERWPAGKQDIYYKGGILMWIPNAVFVLWSAEASTSKGWALVIDSRMEMYGNFTASAVSVRPVAK